MTSGLTFPQKLMDFLGLWTPAKRFTVVFFFVEGWIFSTKPEWLGFTPDLSSSQPPQGLKWLLPGLLAGGWAGFCL